ncbi:MAG: Rpn family recombination-promoting nuclease/putative transposase [Roseburia sp.]|nr:Rpn family recombination-promoting nuclease/putative transposase [Roseburia sp.]
MPNNIGNTLSYEEATGTIDYTLTNDYMFRAILQSNEKVLRGLISSLLHLKPEEIQTVEIKNPIELGKAINNKNFILDIRVLLNNNMVINLEMQVSNHGDWPDRALSYLCRGFDNLQKGEEYDQVLPAIHIGILDFILFPDDPEFYAMNKLMNVRSHKVFNDKFILNVLSLKQIELATEEDKAWELDKWAKLFSAKTWRDIKMLAKNNEIFTAASETLYQFNSDDLIREQCQARMDYERHERYVKRKLAEQEQALKECHDTINEQADTIKEQERLIKKLQEQLAEKNK